MSYSKKLLRQIRKCFGENLEKDLDAFFLKMKQMSEKDSTATSSPQQLCESSRNLLSHLPDFLQMIDTSYQEMEEKALTAKRSLEIGSKELEEANFRLITMNTNVEAMLNCLGQGFVMINRDGMCLPGSSKISEKLLEINPSQKDLVEVLKIPEEKRETILNWVELLFLDITEFEDLAKVGPTHYPHSQGLIIELEFKPIRNSLSELISIVMVATDKTETYAARLDADRMMAHAQMVSAILKDKNQFISFLKYARNAIRSIIEDYRKLTTNCENIQYLKFQLHTLKGSSATFGFYELQKIVHEAEDSLQDFLKTGDLPVRFSDQLKGIEFQFQKAMNDNKDLFESVLSASGPIREIELDSLVQFKESLFVKDKNTLIENFEKKFIQLPAEKVFSRFDSVLKETSSKLKVQKPILLIDSDGTRLIPEGMEDLLESFSHIFRNFVFHGLETNAERINSGKPLAGTIHVTVETELSKNQKFLKIQIQDDGRGVDPEIIKQKIIESGDEKKALSLDKSQLINYIFESEFSTAKEISNLAGRGVGLSAVKNEVINLGGTIEAESHTGEGLTFTILIPDEMILENLHRSQKKSSSVELMTENKKSSSNSQAGVEKEIEPNHGLEANKERVLNSSKNKGTPPSQMELGGIDVSFLHPFMESAQNLFKLNMGTDLKFGLPHSISPDFTNKDSKTNGDSSSSDLTTDSKTPSPTIIGMIPMKSDEIEATIVITFDETTIKSVIQRMLGPHKNPTAAETQAAVGELLNIIFTNGKATLNREGRSVKPALPVVTLQVPVEIQKRIKGRLMTPCRSELGNFSLEVWSLAA